MSVNTIVVIGSNCFTGSHIVDVLLEKPTNFAVGVSRSPEKKSFFLPYKARQSNRFRFHQLNLVSQADQIISLLDQYEPSCVINVAALSEVGLSNFQPSEYFETNSLGVVRLCNALRERTYLKRYIHISSAEVYGSCTRPLHETAPLNPSTPYAVSKAAADMYLLTLSRNFGFPMNLIRSTNVYGKHQQLYKIIPRTMIYLRQGRTIELHGDGEAVRAWLHVRDVARGINLVMEKGRSGEIYHFSDENSVSIADLVRTICEQMGYDFKSSTTSVPERVGQDARYLLDYKKAKSELGWMPQVPFREGLRETAKWVEENWLEIEKESLSYVHQV